MTSVLDVCVNERAELEALEEPRLDWVLELMGQLEAGIVTTLLELELRAQGG